MSWSNNVVSVLVIMVAVVAVAGGAAAFAMIFRQGGWKLAEPSVRKARWQMVRPWLLVGMVIGLLSSGIAFVFLNRMEEPTHAAPKEVITSPPTEIKSRPRDGGQPTE